MYNNIINPITKKKVSINTIAGIKILHEYIGFIKGGTQRFYTAPEPFINVETQTDMSGLVDISDTDASEHNYIFKKLDKLIKILTSSGSNCRCPISYELFIDPVIASDGHTYERDAILEIFKNSSPKSPLTREFLEKVLKENLFVKNYVNSMIDEYNHCKTEIEKFDSSFLTTLEKNLPKTDSELFHASSLIKCEIDVRLYKKMKDKLREKLLHDRKYNDTISKYELKNFCSYSNKLYYTSKIKEAKVLGEELNYKLESKNRKLNKCQMDLDRYKPQLEELNNKLETKKIKLKKCLTDLDKCNTNYTLLYNKYTDKLEEIKIKSLEKLNNNDEIILSENVQTINNNLILELLSTYNNICHSVIEHDLKKLFMNFYNILEKLLHMDNYSKDVTLDEYIFAIVDNNQSFFDMIADKIPINLLNLIIEKFKLYVVSKHIPLKQQLYKNHKILISFVIENQEPLECLEHIKDLLDNINILLFKNTFSIEEKVNTLIIQRMKKYPRGISKSRVPIYQNRELKRGALNWIENLPN